MTAEIRDPVCNMECSKDTVVTTEFRGKTCCYCLASCPGIFAAGDITNACGKRIIIASDEGARAAMAARQYLLALKKKEATVCA